MSDFVDPLFGFNFLRPCAFPFTLDRVACYLSPHFSERSNLPYTSMDFTQIIVPSFFKISSYYRGFSSLPLFAN